MSRRKFSILFLVLFVFGFVFIAKTHAQMMGNSNNQITSVPTKEDLQDIQTGENLYNKLQSKEIPCNQLKDNDFEKIGEYVMNQRFGNTGEHLQMNTNMKQMMGEQGEENMHILLGKTATGCNTNDQSKGGVSHMMGWGYSNMMNGSFGWGFASFHFLIAAVVLVDLILLGIWLWKKIQK